MMKREIRKELDYQFGDSILVPVALNREKPVELMIIGAVQNVF
jgi:hypothetical protein